jgi:hypothetical protein
MPQFELETRDGQKYQVEAADVEAATKALQYIANPPPPGVMIHEPNRSYITGAPDAPSVDTTGMAPGMGMGAAPGTNAALPNRNQAAAALAARRDNPIADRTLLPALQGGTLGYGDEFASLGAASLAALRGRPFGETYDLAQEAQRQDLAQVRQEYPKSSTALQIGGALATAPLAGALGLGRLAAGGAPLGARIAGGAGIGAGYGAVSGFGEGSGLEDRLAKTVPGVATGFVVGGAIPLAGSAAQNLTRRGLDYLNIDRNLGNLGVGRPAGNTVLRTLEADDAFTGAGRASILSAGPEGMLADAGPATRGLLDTVIQRGGGGSRAAREAVEQRGTAANQTLNDALDAALGLPQGVQTTIQGINRAGQAGRRTAYDAAYNTPIDYSAPAARDLQDLLHRVPGDVINTANRLMQLGGHQSRQIQATIDNAGNVTYTRLPDVRQIDYITRAMRQLAESGETTGALGRATPLSQAYNNLAGDVRRTTRDLVPQYGTALDTAADDIGRVQATRLGADILSPAMTRDEVAQALARHTPSAAEMQAVRSGVRSHIDDLMAKTRAIATDPNQDAREAAAALRSLNSREGRDKLDMIITDPVMRQQVANQLDEATRAITLRADMTANSKTFARTAQSQATKEMLEPGPLGAAARGHPVNAVQRAVQALTGRTPAYDVGREDAMNRQIAELLTVARGPQAQAQLDALRRAYTAGPQNAARAQQTGQVTGLAGLPVYQALRGLLGY